MAICFNALASEFPIEAQGHDSIEHCVVHRDSMVAYNDAMREAFLSLAQLPPLMFSNVFDSVSFIRVGIQNLS